MPVLFWLLRLQQGKHQMEMFVLRSCHRWANKVNPSMNHTDGKGLGGGGRERWGGVFMEGYWEGSVWLFSERFIWMLNQELAL